MRCAAVRGSVPQPPAVVDVAAQGVDGSRVVAQVVELGAGVPRHEDGRHLLEGGPDSATCTRTDQEADLALSAADLGAIYLGGIRPSVLARAGRIAGGTPEDRAALDVAFGGPVPWMLDEF